jgi:hypothetical protein
MQINYRRNTIIRISITFLVLAGMLFVSSCENEIDQSISGLIDLPYLIQVNLNHTILDLDTDTTGCVDSAGLDLYTISITATGTGILPSGKNTEGLLQAFKPTSSTPFYRNSWDMTPPTTDTSGFSVPLSFTINRSDVGSIRIEFAFRTNTGEMSNTVTQSLQITRNNIKPYLYNLIAPDTIIRPASGTVLLIFSVMAADSDGYSDLREVFFKRILPTETGNFLLFDDGNMLSSGDDIPGDGRFTRILSIDSTARLGDQVFLFRASDKSAALSDSLLHTITILQ